MLNLTRGRGQHRLGLDALRRHLQPLRAHAAAVRDRGALRRPGRAGEHRGARRRRRRGSSSPRRSATRSSTSSTSRRGPTPRTRHGLPLVVDNTVLTPILCRAFDHGVDVVVHSATKYIGGHGTSIGGVIVDSGKFDWVAHAERFPGLTEARSRPTTASSGRTRSARPPTSAASAPCCCATRAPRSPVQRVPLPAGPRDAAAAHGAPLRERARGGAAPRGARRRSPGSATRASSRAPTRRSPTGSCTAATAALVTFGIEGGRRGRARSSSRASSCFSHLANIGDAKSLAIHHATTTHSQLNDEELAASGVTQDTVRLSVGIEHIDDILADLDQALAKRRAREVPPEPRPAPTGGSVGLVETERVVLFTEDDPLVLDSGATARPGRGRLRDVRRARRRRRRTPSSSATRSRATPTPPATTATPPAAGLVGRPIGPGKPLDTDRCSSSAPTCSAAARGTTGPSSTDPATGRPYGLRFPPSRSPTSSPCTGALLDRLGIRRLRGGDRRVARRHAGAAVGARPPRRDRRRHPRLRVRPASARRTSPSPPSARDSIMRDEHFHGRRLLRRGARAGRRALRRPDDRPHHLRLGGVADAQKFGRRRRATASPADASSSTSRSRATCITRARRFLQRFDANTYLYLTPRHGLLRPVRRARAAPRSAIGPASCSSPSTPTGASRRPSPG